MGSGCAGDSGQSMETRIPAVNGNQDYDLVEENFFLVSRQVKQA